MSQELYTFACPSCAVKLSVPKALAGVRGPCPQCHAEITAPTPEPEAPPPSPAFPQPATEAPAPGIPAPLSPPPRPEMAAGPAPLPPLPELSQAPQPPFPPAMEEVTDDIWRRPARSVAPPLDSPSAEEPASPRHAPAPTPRRGMSKSALVGSLLVLLALGAIAALNFLPSGTLKKWVDQAKERVMSKMEGAPSEEPAAPPADTPPLPPTAATPEEMPAATADFRAPEPTSTPAEEPLTAEIPSETAPDDAPEEVPATPALTVKPAEEPVPEIARAEPAASSSVAATGPASAGPPSLLPDISAPASEPASTAEVDAEALAAPRKALTDFLGAKTWRERLPHSLGGDSLRTEMQQYYKTAKDGASTPTSLEYISHSTVPGTDLTVHAFYATFADLPQGFPISVEETAQGWKVDWRAFTEFREGRLKKFFDKYQSAPATFRVVLRRTHFFDKDVPNLDNKYCFHISAPAFGQGGYVFVNKDDSIVTPKIAAKLDWKGVHYDMVKLKWVKGRNNHSYVELRDIIDGWREAPAKRAD